MTLRSAVSEVLNTPPVTVGKVVGHRFHRRPKKIGGRDPELLDSDTISTTIAASGTRHLRVVVLYQYPHTRRIQNLLAYHFAVPQFAASQNPDRIEMSLGSGSEPVLGRRISAGPGTAAPDPGLGRQRIPKSAAGAAGNPVRWMVSHRSARSGRTRRGGR
jgi:hypothetical protein